MTTKHKHYDLIMAWANGAEIEYFAKGDGFDCWTNVKSPSWNENTIYRIKPEPKPDIFLYAIAYSCNFDGTSASLSRASYFDYFDGVGFTKPNLKLTYDDETKNLIAVELI